MSGLELLSGIGMGVGMGTAYGGLVDILRTGITWAKWKAVGHKFSYDCISEVLQSIINAEKDEVHGLSTKGMVDAIQAFIDRTLDMSFYVNEQIASQLFVQMIQQSIAYAIHSSHAGSIGTVCNVYSGSASLSSMVTDKIGSVADLADRGTKAFLSASTGLNIPSTAFSLMQGGNTRIEEVYRRVIAQADAFLDEWNDLALGYYRHYNTMARNRFQDALEMKEQIVTRAYGFLETVANEHLARISEQLDTLTGAKEWFDGGLASADELEQISLRVDIERQASEANFNDYVTEIVESIEASINEWDNKLRTALDDMKECEYRYNLLINSMFSTLFSDVRTFVQSLCDELDKTVEDVCAYRNIKQAVRIEEVTNVGEFESSPEMVMYRLRQQRWKDIDDVTIAFNDNKYRSIDWETDVKHDKGVHVLEKATVVQRKRWAEVQQFTVIPYTDLTPLVSWESVE